MTRSRAALPAALGLLLLLSACAERPDAGAAPPEPSTPAPTPAPTSAELPAGEGLVLQVEHTGGFVTPETTVGRLPLVAVYADGRVFTQGPVAAIYPGFAWPNVQVQQADPDTVQALVDRALAAGVGETTDLGSPPIADAPSTRFTLTTAGGTVVREVYALNEGEGVGTGLSAEQRQARGELVDLLAELTDLQFSLQPGGSAPPSYEPAAVAALVRPWTPGEADPMLGDQPALPWPGPALPGEPVAPGVTCVLATGEAAGTVRAAASEANTLTPWSTADGARWSITFRPLLPHETGCTDLTD